LSEWKRERLYERFGVVFQDFMRYQFKAGENIGVGDDRYFADETRWRRAARLSTGDAVIEQLPAAYHSMLGRRFDDGSELSGGQWQRIALARAFMRSGADIIILDEPTSMVDARAEREIFKRIEAELKDQTIIFLSHRFANVRMADRIIVLDEGKLTESGTHAELMRLDGRYAQLFEMQARGYQ
ncbi:MAG: ABC transporter ATP-binding protein, partial [Leptospiraceae bacterium]|nr:ABC transporter ATP-binding protein [Leptospiraceae bacterium]